VVSQLAQKTDKQHNFWRLLQQLEKSTAPLWVDIDTNECFLQTGESVGQDTHHMLDCECDKVKCNCVKHCECSLPTTSTGTGTSATNHLLQLDQGVGLKKETEEEEKKTVKKESEEKKEEPQELIQKDAETKKVNEEVATPVQVAPRARGRGRVSKEQKQTAPKSTEENKDEYSKSGEYSQASEKSGSGSSYSNSENEEYSN